MRSTPLIALFLSGCASPADSGLFHRHEVPTRPAQHQVVLTGFLLGGAVADLAVVSVDEIGGRCLRIHAFDGGSWSTILEATLRPGVSYVDVARIGGRDRLVTYQSGRLSWFDPDSSQELVLVAIPSSCPSPASDFAHVDVTRDVNGDDRDDLVVPDGDGDGFWVFTQREGGTFADPVKVGPPVQPDRIRAAYGYRHDPWLGGRIHEVDYDRDGRGDLVFWNGERFEVHRQDEDGTFTPQAQTFSTAVAFDSDDMASLAAPHGVRRRRMDHNPDGSLTGRVLHSMADMNGDGVADLGVFSLQGGSLREMSFGYEVYLGAPTPDGGTAFAREAGAAIRSKGIPFLLGPHDVDHDGRVDMMFAVTKVGVFRAIGMLIDSFLTDSVSVDLELYRMAGGGYPEKPDTTRKVKTVSFGRSGERATVFPSTLIGDVDGDGRPDLLVQERREELRVFLGVPGRELFARRPRSVPVAMPDEEYTWLVDLNRDGKQDLVMHHQSRSEPQRVSLLVAR